MKLSIGIQESLLVLLCNDAEAAPQVLGMIKPEDFDPFYKDVASAAESFYEQFGTTPDEHTFDLIEDLQRKRPKESELFGDLYASMERTRAGGINRTYVLDRAGIFARHQRLKAGIGAALEQLARGDDAGVLGAEEAVSGALGDSLELFNPGTRMGDLDHSLSFLERDEVDTFPTGILELDRRGLGPGRGKLHMLQAVYGRGKTWWFINLGKQAIIHHQRVMHISLEMSEPDVLQRYFQNFFSVSKRGDSDLSYNRIETDELGRFVSFNHTEMPRRPALDDRGIKKVLRDKAKVVRGLNNLLVKQFPTGQLDVRELRSYIAAVEAREKFIPDLIMIDYPELMQIDKNNERASIKETYKAIRGIAVERNIAIAVVSQINRAGGGAKMITGQHTADDWSKNWTVDVSIIFNQTQQEKEMGLARLFVDKGRGDEDNFQILISQNYAAGQFVMQSARMSSSYWGHLNKGKDDEED